MTWTPKDTEALRALLVVAPGESQKFAVRPDPLCRRAAEEIERLTAELGRALRLLSDARDERDSLRDMCRPRLQFVPDQKQEVTPWDVFAAAALTGFAASQYSGHPLSGEASLVAEWADAMMKERAKR